MPKGVSRYVVEPEAKRQVRARARKYAPEDKPLSRREELFVKELVAKDGQITMREAAMNAGFPEKSAHARAWEMTNPERSPHVVKAIREFRAQLDRKYGIDYKRHLRDLQIIRDKALESGAYSAAVQAEYRRGQAQGDIYVSKSEIRHGTIDSMTKDEVLKAIAELKQQYAPVTIDVTPNSQSNTGNRQKVRSRLLAADADSVDAGAADKDVAGDAD